MTPEERRADDERFRKLPPADQIRELKDLLAEVEAAIDEAERKSKSDGVGAPLTPARPAQRAQT